MIINNTNLLTEEITLNLLEKFAEIEKIYHRNNFSLSFIHRIIYNYTLNGGIVMPAYKNTERGTWYIKFYYTDWTGEKKLRKNVASKKV